MKNKVFNILFISIIFLFMLIAIIMPDKDISITERRKLAQFPNMKLETILNGDFFEELDDYFIEQFPFRDNFRKIKGIVSKYLFQKRDEDGIFIQEDAIYQLEPSIHEDSVFYFTGLVNQIQNTYLQTENVYYAVIPDKNYYLDSSIPKLDYQNLEQILNEELTDMTYINLFDSLDLSSYYKTDIHWKQEKLEKVVEKIETSMNLEKKEIPKEKKNYPKFYGALYGRIANNLNPDTITYLTNQEIENATVFDYEKKEYRKVYEEKDLSNIDSYDIYLGGAKPLLIIENKEQTNQKELILFRDSFGSSISPLLLSNYSKITLIDLRYLSSSLLEQINEITLDKENQDVLFLYSVPIINNSFTLR